MYRRAFGPTNLDSDHDMVGAASEHTDTNMSPVETIQMVGRVRASQEAGVPLQTGKVPGREMAGDGAQTECWVPEAGKLTYVLKETGR